MSWFLSRTVYYPRVIYKQLPYLLKVGIISFFFLFLPDQSTQWPIRSGKENRIISSFPVDRVKRTPLRGSLFLWVPVFRLMFSSLPSFPCNQLLNRNYTVRKNNWRHTQITKGTKWLLLWFRVPPIYWPGLSFRWFTVSDLNLGPDWPSFYGTRYRSWNGGSTVVHHIVEVSRSVYL